MEAAPTAISGLHLVPFRDVLENVVVDAQAELQALAERLPALGDEERKRQLLLHLQATRQRLQRLHVCAQWAHKAKAVNTCREVLKAAQDHGAAFVHTADELFRLHEELRFSRAPLFDVSTALHISQTGTYRLLPRVIEDELQQPGQRLERPVEVDEAARSARSRDALRRLDFLLRSKLLTSDLPAGLRVLRVRGGQAAVAAAGGQYTAALTLVPAPRDDVTLTKYRPPGEAEAAAVKEEVTQPVAAAEQPSTSAAAAPPAASPAAGYAAAQQRQGADAWRWQLLSFELLPAAAAHDPPPLLPAQRTWLQQHIEQRMWAAADVEQLARLGKQAWVTVPEPPGVGKQAVGTAGKASSAPAPSASLAPSHLAAAAGTAAAAQAAAAAAADAKGKAPVKEEPEEHAAGAAVGEAAAATAAAAEGPRLPAHAVNPLAAMHAILCQTAGRLALFSLLLGDARQLEGGSWKGRLKLSRASSGTGLRFAYWQQVPCVSYAELQCLREGRPYQAETATAAGAAAAGPGPGSAAGASAQQQQQQQQQQAAAPQEQQAPAVDVELQGDGGLAASSSPQLRHALTGKEVQLALPLDSAASLDADRLLLTAAAHSAAAQLAAVQAEAQRGGRLAAAGNHAELSVPAVAASGAGPLPASPQLLLWSGGSLQLSLSVQLRAGRLLLLAGPALLESEQSGEAAAAVAAAQQQLDAAQRDATTQPLPAGCTRGMLAARLAGDVLTRLSVQLSMRRRMDAAAAAAAACGLRRTALPPQLLDQHFREAPPLLAPLSRNTLTLALPAFPPPHDMQRWARQQQQRQRQGVPVGSGAVRCFLLVDYGEPGAAAAAAAAGREGGGAAGSDAAAAELGGAAEQEAARMLLAVCACTSRGTVTRVLQLAPVPLQVAAAVQPPRGAAAASRKRRASDAAAEGALREQQAVGGSDGEHVALEAAAAWCRRQAGWEALRAQLLLLPVQHAEELPLATLPQQQQQVIRLPSAPVLARLEAWAAGQLAAAGGDGATVGAPKPRPAAVLQLEGGGGGAWRVDLASAYFARLPALLAQQGVLLAAPAPDAQHMAAHAAGLSLRYSLAAGHSVLAAISDLVRLGMLHLCLTRLAGCMAANPLAAGGTAKAGGGGGGANGSLVVGAPACNGPTNGSLANGGPQLDGVNGSAGGASLVWPLPGCGSVRLVEAGLTHFVLAVAPPQQPESAAKAGQPAPARLTVSWDNTLLSDGSGGGGAASAAAKESPAAQQPRGDGGGPAATAPPPAAQAGGLLRHIRCSVASEPPLPEPVAAALAQQLEAGRADLFLDSLCLAAHAAAAAQRQLAPEAQRAAGLLPGALRVAGAGGSAGGSADVASAGSSALRLRAQLQQGGRAASLCLGFHAGGYTLVQLAPGLGGTAAAGAHAWLPALWDRLSQSVPTFAAVTPDPPKPSPGQPGEQQQQQQQVVLRQAWVHHSGLGAALAGIAQAVAAPAAA
ncbi:mediator of RNA polymerase II transcription subunit 14 isoform A [Micractinium conductrix]|uniref:Mediator of RNA polymerase II transcription subunit 14 n=1 Tax=Micractinium conductrix TaxID=554055 RepID=A0A2P6VA73_9CHLO|nr:mediator of RNA polymerase II transcription subunit 14 isoform A [Micractinium conductrix]|eukprot:PSC70987.1 mediator of RNA polymerase II transcription subunit 14 isoform A [Micractinium conductrix]